MLSHKNICIHRESQRHKPQTEPKAKKKMDYYVGNSFLLILTLRLYCAVKQAITWQQLGGLKPNTWPSSFRALQWQLTVQCYNQVAPLQ